MRRGTKYTTLEYKKKLKEVNPDIELIEEYQGAHKKVKFKCLRNTLHPIWQSYANHALQGHGCPACVNLSRDQKYQERKIDEICQKRDHERKSHYISSKHKIKYFCKKHKKYFWQIAGIIKRTGCRQCSLENRSKIHTNSQRNKKFDDTTLEEIQLKIKELGAYNAAKTYQVTYQTLRRVIQYKLNLKDSDKLKLTKLKL